MNHLIPTSTLAFALCMACGLAHGAEVPVHNDLDGDGRSDLIWRNATTGALVYWSAANAARSTRVQVTRTYNTPIGFDLARSTIAFAFNNWSISAADLLVEDGKGDLIVMMWESSPSGYVAYTDSVVSVDWTVVGAGDFNADGYGGVVFRNRRDGSNMIGFLDWDAGRRFVPISPVADLAWSIAGIDDFDGDGSSDLLWRHAVTGRNVIWRSANSATAADLASVTNLDWKIAAVADFNGDGRADIFWRNTRTGADVIWNSGNKANPRAVRGVTNQGWQVTATGDFDGDGRFDLFWRNRSTGANVIWKSANASTQLAVAGVINQDWSTVK